MASMTAPLPWTRNESRPVNASLVLTSKAQPLEAVPGLHLELRESPGGMGAFPTVSDMWLHVLAAYGL